MRRIVFAGIVGLACALAVPLGSPAAAAPTRPDATNAAASFATSRGYHIGVAVYDTWTGRYYGAGDDTGTFASESVVKVFIAARLLATGQMHGTTASMAWTMITRSDDGMASALYGRVGGDGLITWIKDHYDLPNLGSPPRVAGWWGNTHITPVGMVHFYAKVKNDPAVGPWLINAMHHATTYGSDGTYQFFGLPSATSGAAIKQGWGCDYDDLCNSMADFNSTGYVNGDRYAVALLARAPISTYGKQISDLLTGVARTLLPGGRFPNLLPEIAGMSRHAGATGGGPEITLFGAGFAHATSVAFGTVPARSWRVVDDRHVEVAPPAHVSGPVTVHVRTPVGVSGYPTTARYSYLTVPTVLGLSQHAGGPRGGSTITVYGNGFTGATAASVGLVRSASWRVISDHRLVLRTPPHAAGTVYVRVRTPAGSSSAALKAHFDYVPQPAITGASPGRGPTAGGTVVTVVGSGFTAVREVLFGTVPAASFDIVDDQHLRAVTPEHDAFYVYVHVRTAWDDSGWADSSHYRFVP